MLLLKEYYILKKRLLFFNMSSLLKRITLINDLIYETDFFYRNTKIMGKEAYLNESNLSVNYIIINSYSSYLREG